MFFLYSDTNSPEEPTRGRTSAVPWGNRRQVKRLNSLKNVAKELKLVLLAMLFCTRNVAAADGATLATGVVQATLNTARMRPIPPHKNSRATASRRATCNSALW